MKQIILLILLPICTYAQTTVVDTIGGTANIEGDAASLDKQILYITNDVLYIERGNSVDLTPYLDNTDQQNISYFHINTSTNILSIAIDQSDTLQVDLSGLNLVGLSPQDLSLSGNTLEITGGTSVDLSSYVDTDDQDLGSSASGTNRTITITDGSSTTISVADNDNDSTNELYDDTDVYVRISELSDSILINVDDIAAAVSDILNRVSIPASCTSGQVLKYNGTTFTCQADAVTGSPDGYISDASLSGTTLTLTGESNAFDGTVSFSGWDTNGSDDVLTTDAFGGDVSGTYDAIVVADNSHNHSSSSITTNIVSSIDGVTNDGGNIDFIGSGITITPDNANDRITFTVASSSTNLSTTTNSANGTGAVNLLSSSGSDIVLSGAGPSGNTPVHFQSASSSIIGASVDETDPNVPAHVKTITQAEKTAWNDAYSWGDHDGLYSTGAHSSVVAGKDIDVSGSGGAYTIDVDLYEAATKTTMATNDYIVFLDESVTAKDLQKMTLANFKTLVGDGTGTDNQNLTTSNYSSGTQAVTSATLNLAGSASNVTIGRHGSTPIDFYSNGSSILMGISGLTSTTMTNWNTAYGWGNHASAGYLVAGSNISVLNNNTGYITSTIAGQFTAGTVRTTKLLDGSGSGGIAGQWLKTIDNNGTIDWQTLPDESNTNELQSISHVLGTGSNAGAQSITNLGSVQLTPGTAPTCTNGTIYYNTSSHHFFGCANGTWKQLDN